MSALSTAPVTCAIVGATGAVGMEVVKSMFTRQVSW